MRRLINTLKILLLSLATALTLGGAAYALPASGVADIASSKNAVCTGVDATGSGGCGGTGSATPINNLVKNIINLLSAIVGIVAVIMMIVAGMKFVTSGGDANKVAGAKSTMIYAIVGILIVALAQVIVKFVIGKA